MLPVAACCTKLRGLDSMHSLNEGYWSIPVMHSGREVKRSMGFRIQTTLQICRIYLQKPVDLHGHGCSEGTPSCCSEESLVCKLHLLLLHSVALAGKQLRCTLLLCQVMGDSWQLGSRHQCHARHAFNRGFEGQQTSNCHHVKHLRHKPALAANTNGASACITTMCTKTQQAPAASSAGRTARALFMHGKPPYLHGSCLTMTLHHTATQLVAKSRYKG
jgi:hypothetical protein